MSFYGINALIMHFHVFSINMLLLFIFSSKMVIFHALAQTARIPLKGQILQGSAVACLPILFGNVIQNKFHTNSRLCQKSSPINATKPFNLSFTDYLKLKQSLRTKQRIAGIPFAFTGMTLSSIALTYAYPDMFDATPEDVQLILGLDPLVFSGISGVIAAGIGYILGTAVFKLAWRKMNRTDWEDMDARDRDFLHRLDKYRFGADSKFEDDYYGESIKTLSDYRQWVRTHQRKRENHAKYELSAIKDKLE